MDQDNASCGKVKALEIALKLFEICEPAKLESETTDVMARALIEAAAQIEQFIKKP